MTAPHAPTAGIGKRIFGRFHGSGVFWMQMMFFVGRVVPPWLMRLGEPLVRWTVYLLWRGVSRALGSNLETVLGPSGSKSERRRRTMRSLKQFGICLYDRNRALAGAARPDARFVNLEHWNAAMQPGRGTILVTAHIGGWELGSALPPSEGDRRVHVVREREADDDAQAYIEKKLSAAMPEHYVTHYLSEGAGSRDKGFELVRLLRDGEIVAVQGDRPRHGGRSVPGTLFGKPFEFPGGPMMLAHAGGATVLPVFSFCEGVGKYRVRFAEPIEVDSVNDGIAKLSRAIEDAIREEPYQWFCFRELWPQDGT